MDILCGTLMAVSLIASAAQTVEPAGRAGGGAYRVGNGVAAPILLSKTEPMYSEEARKIKYGGTVVLYTQIDPSGTATNIHVIKSLGFGLDEKAMEAVETWKFKPGYKDGAPVTVEATIEVNFRLLEGGWTIARQDFVTAAGVSKPVLTTVPSPLNCKSADARLELSVSVRPDGTVGDVRVVSSTDASLNQGIADSVEQWIFAPALRAGAPQAAEGQIDVVCSAARSPENTGR